MKFNKNLLLALLALLISGSVIGQSEYSTATYNGKSYRFGFKICPNFSSLKTVNSATDEHYKTEKIGQVTGFGFGLITDIRMSDHYYIATGINVITGGGSLNVTSTMDSNRSPLDLKSGDITYKLQYIEFPVGFKFYNDIAEGVKAYATLGLQLALTIGKKARYDNILLYNGGPATNSGDQYEKITGLSITPSAFGMNLGAGITYNLNENLDALVGFRFTNYFLPDITLPQKGMLYSGAGGQEIKFDDGKQRLNGFQINLGLLF